MFSHDHTDKQTQQEKQITQSNQLEKQSNTLQRTLSNPSDNLTKSHIMQLQRTIGNQAVIQLMKSRLSPRNSEDPIQMKKQSNDEEAAPFQINENRTGMPDNLKAGIENLSGYSMDDVRVHYNSDKPTQVGALAYAQGSDIHLAQGQEKHLPHEAWHVVQQKQDRVQPTMQLKGIDVNDNESLEREATEMGNKALNGDIEQTVGSNFRTGEKQLNSGNPIQRKVIQMIATQIVLDDSSNIHQVVVRGRPERVFTNSMGDHTTAFIVHTEGLNIALQGQSVGNAIQTMVNLMNSLGELPGYQIMISGENANTDIATRFNREAVSLRQNLEQAQGSSNPDVQIQYLQHAINAYLSARELVPFSTINVGEKSKGSAGKGHGESGHAAVLSTYERNPDSGITTEQLVNAVYGLFDYQSARMVSVEQQESMIGRMTAGISFGKNKNATERLTMIWNQHKASIEKMFPICFKEVKDVLGNDRIQVNIDKQYEIDFMNLLNLAKVTINQIRASYFTLSAGSGGFNLSYYKPNDLNYSKIENVDRIFKDEVDFLLMYDDLNNLNAKCNNRFSELLKGLNEEIVTHEELSEDALLTMSKALSIVKKYIAENLKGLKERMEASVVDEETKKLIKIVDILKTIEQGSPIKNYINKYPDKFGAIKMERISQLFSKNNGDNKKMRRSTRKKENVNNVGKKHSQSQKVEKSKNKNPGSSNKKVDKSTLTSGMCPMSIQVLIDSNGLIEDMISNGRPKSPFSGTMGAHSTAWVVHLDRIRSLIKGKTINAAIEEMKNLFDEFKLFARSRFNGESNELTNKEKYIESKINKGNISVLQMFINDMLSYYNLIPGVTREKIDTTGKGEGTYRKVLLLYERYGKGTKEELEEAIKGLYDGRDRQALWDNHLKVIEGAYPDSFKRVIRNAEAKKEVKVPQSVLDSNEVEEEVYDEEYDVQQLDTNQINEIKEKAETPEWLWGVNNCLINAITDAAGVSRATKEQIIQIRTAIGAPAGVMLFASTRVLNIILEILGLQNRGAIVLYQGEEYTDRSGVMGQNPLYIFHDGINHFTALIKSSAKESEINRKRRLAEVNPNYLDGPDNDQSNAQNQDADELLRNRPKKIVARRQKLINMLDNGQNKNSQSDKMEDIIEEEK